MPEARSSYGFSDRSVPREDIGHVSGTINMNRTFICVSTLGFMLSLSGALASPLPVAKVPPRKPELAQFYGGYGGYDRYREERRIERRISKDRWNEERRIERRISKDRWNEERAIHRRIQKDRYNAERSRYRY